MFLQDTLTVTRSTHTQDPITDLSEIVQIDSHLLNIDGIKAAQFFMARKYQALGFDIEFKENKLIKSAPLLIARKFVSKRLNTVTLVCHTDTVGKLSLHPFVKKENKLFGAGIADDKAGVIVGYYAIKNFLESIEHQNLNINIVISPNEETGSIGFHEEFKKIGLESKIVIGLEPALNCGSLIGSRSGNRWYQLKVKGIAAHAGRFGHSHINAAHKLSLIVSELMKLNSEKDLRRVNVGSFYGGEGFNTICSEAFAKIDTRFSKFECRDLLHESFVKTLNLMKLSCPYTDAMSEAYFSIEDDCPPMECSSRHFSSLAESIQEMEGHFIDIKHSGGAADINYLSTPSNFCIDGVGGIGNHFHTRKEYVEIDSLFTRNAGLSLYLQKLNFIYGSFGGELCH